MKIFLDTNIFIDFFVKRGDFFGPAKKLLTLGALGEYQMWTGASQITDIFYILTNSKSSKRLSAAEAKNEIAKLRRKVRVSALTEEDLDAALASSWTDFEDACAYQCASKIKADAIISRNKKDFEKSSIRVLDCEEWFDYLKETQNVTYEEFDL